ncbi:MAG TPA: phosphotransferase family protein [Pseudomonadales bacterium]|nr:phosphotransferase family protein [Pseudomonadales bacterium]
MSEDLRPTPSLADPEAVRERLQEWLNETVFIGKPISINSFTIPEGTGMSNITVLFDAQRENNSEMESQPMVARLQAQGDKLAFPAYDLPLQFAAMAMLTTVPGIAVPGLVAQEPTGTVLGMPFYIMKKTDGLIPPDIPPYHIDGWIVTSTPEERERLWWSGVEMMAKLHCLSLHEEPLQSFVEQQDFPRGLGEQLQYWESYMHWGLEGAHNLHCETALEWLKCYQPANEPQAFCWGDSRMANVIFREDKSGVAALLDWEMLVVGNPVQDIAWWIFMDELFSLGLGCPRLEGFPSRNETIQYWSGKTGVPADALHYYLVFAGLRISLILARMSLAKGDNSMVAESFASQYMMKVLQES